MELKATRPATITTSEVTAAVGRRRRAGAAAAGVLLAAGAVLAGGLPGEGTGDPGAGALALALDKPSVVATRFETAGEPVRIRVLRAQRIAIAAPPAHGTARIARDAVVYTPHAGQIGSDRLVLSLCGASGCVARSVSVRTTPAGLSALTGAAPRVLVDTAASVRAPGARVRVRLPRGLAAAAVSVAVHDAVRPGAVTVAAGGRAVDVLRVPATGATASNTVLVPVRDRSLVVHLGSGGRLVVTLVGRFAPTAKARAGRFVPLRRPAHVAHLVTLQDGREGTVPAAAYGARPGVRAALVLVTAQTGPNPSWVTFRSRPDRIDQILPWSPVAGGSIERRGVALVRVGPDGTFSFRYDHGAVVDLQVLGTFTGPGARRAVRGLLIPRDPDTVFRGVVGPRGVRVRGPAGASSVFANLRAQPGAAGGLDPADVGVASGRVIGSVLEARDGKIALRSRQPLAARVDVLGAFAG
jgi:hypothetical protein